MLLCSARLAAGCKLTPAELLRQLRLIHAAGGRLPNDIRVSRTMHKGLAHALDLRCLLLSSLGCCLCCSRLLHCQRALSGYDVVESRYEAAVAQLEREQQQLNAVLGQQEAVQQRRAAIMKEKGEAHRGRHGGN